MTPMSSDAAPGQLELVRQFVNTRELDDGEETEELETPERLSAWLAEHELLPRRVKLDQDDLRHAVRLREALRGMLLANNGAPLDPQTVETLNSAVAGTSVSVRFDEAGRPELAVACSGLDAAVARIAAIVYDAIVDGTWPRLKACAADDCQWAFYDRSKNRSGTWERLKACAAEDCQWAFYDTSRNRSRTWCSMEVCGNRAKTRAYRARLTDG